MLLQKVSDRVFVLSFEPPVENHCLNVALPWIPMVPGTRGWEPLLLHV